MGGPRLMGIGLTAQSRMFHVERCCLRKGGLREGQIEAMFHVEHCRIASAGATADAGRYPFPERCSTWNSRSRLFCPADLFSLKCCEVFDVCVNRKTFSQPFSGKRHPRGFRQTGENPECLIAVDLKERSGFHRQEYGPDDPSGSHLRPPLSAFPYRIRSSSEPAIRKRP